MTAELLDSIQAKLFEIQYLRSRLTEDIAKRQEELVVMATSFNTYGELYTFGKKIAHTPEEFNVMMSRARDIFLNKK